MKNAGASRGRTGVLSGSTVYATGFAPGAFGLSAAAR